MRWRLWPDATDLLALLVLPATWRLMRAQGIAGLRARVLEPAAVMIGGLACLATSAPTRYHHEPFVVNRTEKALEVTLTWVLRRAACDSVLELKSDLGRNDLGDPHGTTLGFAGGTALLTLPPRPGEPLKSCPPTFFLTQTQAIECPVVLVEVAGGPSVLVQAPSSWSESDPAFLFPDEPKSACGKHLAPGTSPVHGSLTIVSKKGHLEVVAGTRVSSVEVLRPEIDARAGAAPGCRVIRDEVRALLPLGASCREDAECQALPPIPIPGEPDSCHLFVNRSTASALEERDKLWREMCLVDHRRRSCHPPQPAVCRAGACGPICPGVDLPTCPRRCNAISIYDLKPGSACAGWENCRHEDEICRCENGTLRCGLTSPDCPIACVEERSPEARDAGATDGPAANRETAAPTREDGGI
jgi:hypothetical protein